MTAPDGISARHSARPGFLHHHASPLAVALLGGLMLAALLGWLGGWPTPVAAARNADAVLTVKAPATIRTGMFFEAAITVTPRRRFADLRIGLAPSLWRDVTQNTMIPAAAEEAFAGALFTFAYGPRTAGDPLEVKLDLQINPSLVGRTAGDIVVLDGETPVLRLPLALRVLP
ncbi:MAG: hypothetical protein PGN09_12160 [Sphingomonas fennica]